jgi:predicted site-specific integrase-resolvase
MEDWYTYKEILKLLGIHKQTLNNWRRNGNIIYKKLSPKIFLYKLPEIKFIQENESSKNL